MNPEGLPSLLEVQVRELREKYGDDELHEYKIPCSWQVYGYCSIFAPTLEDAIEEAENDITPLPLDSSYVDGSFEVDRDIAETHEYNQNKPR